MGISDQHIDTLPGSAQGHNTSAASPSLVSRVRQGQFLQGVAVLAGGTAIAQLLMVLVTPLLTRLYSPDDIGRLGLYLAFVGFASAASSLKYESAIVSARDPREAAYLVLLCAALLVPMSAVSSLALYVLVQRSLIGFGDLHRYVPLVVFLPLTLLGGFTALKYWLIRANEFRMVSSASITQGSVRASSQVGLGLIGLSWPGLLGGDVLGRMLGLSRMVRRSWRAIADCISPFTWGHMGNVILTYQKFPKYSFPSALINNLALVLPVPLVAHLYGIEAAGYFALVMRVLWTPFIFVGTSVGDVFHSRIARYAREEPHRASRFVLHVAGGLFLFGLGPILLLALDGERLFGLVFGERWTTAGLLAAAAAPWAIAQLVVSPVARVVYVYQGQELKLIYDVLSLFAVTGTLFVGHDRGLSLTQAVLLLSLCQALAYGVYFLILLRIVARGSKASNDRLPT